MFDLHCHLLPGIDDGAVDLEMALEMARIAAADGIRTVACTPHIYPGMYDNDAPAAEAVAVVIECTDVGERGLGQARACRRGDERPARG